MFNNLICQHCRESASRLIFKAMLEDAGAKVYPSSTHCKEGKEHDFIERNLLQTVA